MNQGIISFTLALVLVVLTISTVVIAVSSSPQQQYYAEAQEKTASQITSELQTNACALYSFRG